ncbi:MAG: family 43 glycosylhydrolase [Candidatus Symbiothrix sp.]|nr:family 43 glycosylhydrolase [Candidatus Symbiothrix sp.]
MQATKFYSFWVAVLLTMIYSCSEKTQTADFYYLEYQGQDAVFEQVIDSAHQYFNPILSGFYSDPSICRVGNDYYLVTSTFSYYPGIPLFHSTDLVNWTQIGNVLDRRSQLAIKEGVRLSGGVYAPTIRYNPHNETFYMINTLVDVLGNFVVKTKNPMENNWSDPIGLHINGIDPDIFFDDDGKGYIVHNDEPPGQPEWNGHRAIWLREFDVEHDSIVGKKICIVDGGVDKKQQPVWIEAPHLYKMNGYYYLMCAEGGTSDQHSEVIFRADHVKGPYIPWENNPILTQRDLPADRANPITCAGHADLVQTPEGDWWAVFLACRPYEGNVFNTGRETFLLPVKWVDGFPVILDEGKEIPYMVDKPHLQPNEKSLKGNYTYREEFNGGKLPDNWLFLRTPPEQAWWKLQDGKLRLHSTEHTIYEVANPAFVGIRQAHLTFTAQTEIQFNPEKEGDIAGMVCYQKENHNFVFGKTIEDNTVKLVLNRAETTVARIAAIEISPELSKKIFALKINGDKSQYSFSYSFDKGKTWHILAEHVEAKNLSTEVAGGFTGTVIGLYTYKNPFADKTALKTFEKGAFETGQYRNLFAEAGYPQAEIDQKLHKLFEDVFSGENKVYFEVEDSLAYISDLKNNDVRTEGMSYGMMIAVQFDRKAIFDKLWRWSVKYMQHKGGDLKGYFAWHCRKNGERIDQGPASDGELYYITSLLFASNRWGNSGEINYLKEAQNILNCAFGKDGKGGIVNFIDTTHKLITFVPDGAGSAWTDPSYHVPAFYEVWAKWADDGRADFWLACAGSARAYLHQSVDAKTALNADQNNYDGSIMERSFYGRTFRNDAFRFDSWRVPLNIALDYSWSCKDKEWQQWYGKTFQNFLYLQGMKTYLDQYKTDGSKPDWILQAGGKTALRHAIGLQATAAAVSLVCDHPKSYEFIDQLWNLENKPFPDGYFDAYYDGLLQLFAFMHLSGNYRIIE